MPTKVYLVKTMVFPVVMYGCEIWTIKVECWRIDAFQLWCWRRLLRVPWTSKTSNQSILKEIKPEYSLEELMLKLKLQYLGHLMQRIDSLEKIHDAGKDWRQEEKGMTEEKMVGWHHQLNGHEFEQALGDGEGQGSLACCGLWGHKESNTTEQLNNKLIPEIKTKDYVNNRLWVKCSHSVLHNRLNKDLRFQFISLDFSHWKKVKVFITQ